MTTKDVQQTGPYNNEQLVLIGVFAGWSEHNPGYHERTPNSPTLPHFLAEQGRVIAERTSGKTQPLTENNADSDQYKMGKKMVDYYFEELGEYRKVHCQLGKDFHIKPETLEEIAASARERILNERKTVNGKPAPANLSEVGATVTGTARMTGTGAER